MPRRRRERQPSGASETQAGADADGHLDRLQRRCRRRTRSSRRRRTGRAAGRRRPAAARRSPARAGRSSRRSSGAGRAPRPGSGASMSNARIATQTARSCISQPRHWKKIAHGGRDRRLHHGQAPSDHRPEPPHRPELVEHGAVLALRARRARTRTGRRPTVDDDHEARHRPVRDLRGRGARSRRAAARARRRRAGAQATVPTSVTLVPGPCVGRCRRSTADAGQLADPPGQDGVREEADPEGGEHVAEARMWPIERLADRQLPRERAQQDRDEVEHEGGHDPAPRDEVEGVVDAVPVGAAPPQQAAPRAPARRARSRSGTRGCCGSRMGLTPRPRPAAGPTTRS